MHPSTASSSGLQQLQSNTSNIRNICILAHVDHGKTTLADSLIASNGIISGRLAGQLRYMDSLEDEQLRGITMKSSAISLQFNNQQSDYLINLIDSPGHVDFCGEVSTATRLCDGCLVVVDVVEGVCPQTHAVLRQAFKEGLRPLLVMNKLDRLIHELKLSPVEAYTRLNLVLSQVNAVAGAMFISEMMTEAEHHDIDYDNVDAQEQQLYFDPQNGNVLFASASDGWAFSVAQFADILTFRSGVDRETLIQRLWGDYFYDSKHKQVKPNAHDRGKTPIFAQLCLQQIWSVYETVWLQRDDEKLAKIINTLGIRFTARDDRSKDGRVKCQTIMSQWLPLAPCVLLAVCQLLPSPAQLDDRRMLCLLPDMNVVVAQSDQHRDLVSSIRRSASSSTSVIVFVSKMVAVERKSLPEQKREGLSWEELQDRRRQRLANDSAAAAGNGVSDKQVQLEATPTVVHEYDATQPINDLTSSAYVFIAFARVFAGTLHSHSSLLLIKHVKPNANRLGDDNAIDESPTVECKVGQLYIFMGRELTPVESVPAGNIVGIAGWCSVKSVVSGLFEIQLQLGLDEHVLSSATLSTSALCPHLAALLINADPIVRVSIEPRRPAMMGKLRQALRLLQQSDPCVQTSLEETGEIVLATAGEVHLERCVSDLRRRFGCGVEGDDDAEDELIVSAPIIPFMETIVPRPKLDMVNEAIQQIDQSDKELVQVHTSNRRAVFGIRAVPLPDEVIHLLQSSTRLIDAIQHLLKPNKYMTKNESDLCDKILSNAQLVADMQQFRRKLLAAFERTWTERNAESASYWSRMELRDILIIVDQIWSFGAKKAPANLLINRLPEFESELDSCSVWRCLPNELIRLTRTRHDTVKSNDSEPGEESAPNCPRQNVDSEVLLDWERSIHYGFKLTCASGPMCGEPMRGVAFLVEKCELTDTGDAGAAIVDSYGPMSGQIIAAVKEGCRQAFSVQSQRLVAAMYSCVIQATQEVLGKVYAVLSKREGKVLSDEMSEGTNLFQVHASLPVVESFGFANEMRKRTSGLASPQLVFSHWEIIPIDPFWVPTTEEELLHFGEHADSENRALRYMNAVRRRKGLKVDEKIVQFAEKQRTLTKSK